MPKNPGSGQLARTLRSLLFIGAIGVILAVWNSYSIRHDISLATGEAGPAQEQFFVEAAERPDIATFFKNLTAAQRLTMARDIGNYQDAALAKLCGVLLADFDSEARAELTKSLSHVAKAHPEAVAAELKEKGSFQWQGVSAALRSLGSSALPFVLPWLSNDEAKANASAFLVAAGAPAVEPVLPLLDSSTPATRMAAADILGKLRAKQAVPSLLSLYRSSKGDEKTAYLAALAATGDPSTETTMKGVLDDASYAPELRLQAELGLGRIGSPSSVQTLWNHAQDEDDSVKSGVLSALELCPDPAVQEKGTPLNLRLQVAQSTADPVTDAVIRSALPDPQYRTLAARACSGRATLAKDLFTVLKTGSNYEEGEFAEAAVGSLASTQEGRSLLKNEKGNPYLAGFIGRQAL